MHKIALFTGTRAEYGLLQWLYRALADDPRFEPGWIVSGTHLDPAYGGTLEEIEAGGAIIWEKVKLEGLGGSSADMCLGAGQVMGALGNRLGELGVSALVVLGDRYEALAAALTGFTLGIPVIHLHGGEITRGALDDGYRHAITKLAALHFTGAEPYSRRVVQMGEPPETVFNTGAPVNDAIAVVPPISHADLEQELGCELGEPLFLVTMHPETIGETAGVENAQRLAAVLAEIEGACVLWTYANADSGGLTINNFIETLPARYGPRFIARASLGQSTYINAMRHCDVVIGNSSSGVIEAPLIPVASVDIGNRQEMRLRSPSVIDCGSGQDEITAAIQVALSAEHKDITRNCTSPYKGQDVAATMVSIIGDTIDKLGGSKTFYDLDGHAAG